MRNTASNRVAKTKLPIRVVPPRPNISTTGDNERMQVTGSNLPDELVLVPEIFDESQHLKQKSLDAQICKNDDEAEIDMNQDAD